MKKTIFSLLGVGLVFLFVWMWKSESPQNVGGMDHSFNSATSSISNLATSTQVNPYTWTALKYSGNRGVGFMQVCTDANNGNNPIYLAYGATSTKPFGSAVLNNTPPCYKMTNADNNMFYGTIYAIASSATTTLLEVYK